MKDQIESAFHLPPPLDPLSGYLELGMEREALEIARETLAKPDLTAGEFGSVLLATLQTSGSRHLRKQIERAHRRLFPAQRATPEGAMLHFKAGLDELKEALLHIPKAGQLADEDLLPTMHVYLDLGADEAGGETARLCLLALQTTDDDLVKTNCSMRSGCITHGSVTAIARRRMSDVAERSFAAAKAAIGDRE